MATKGSAAGFAAKRPGHLLSEGRRWPPKGQQQVLQQKDYITYFLRAGDGHQKVHSEFVRKERSEYNMHIRNSYLQTMMTDSAICLYSPCRTTYLLHNCMMAITCHQ